MPVYLNLVTQDLRNIRGTLRHLSAASSSEEVHRLRKSLYGAEIAMDALGLPDTEWVRKARKRLHRLRGLAGKVRDLDVFLLAVDALPAIGGVDRVARLRKALKKKRHEKSERLCQYAEKHRKSLRTLPYALEKQARLHAGTDRRIAEAALSAYLQERTSVLALSNQWNRKTLHAYRVAVKQVFYAWKLSGARVNPGLLAELGKAKDTIGTWHDWRELLGFAGELLGETAPCRLLHLLRHHERQAYRRALLSTAATQIAVARWNAAPERSARMTIAP